MQTAQCSVAQCSTMRHNAVWHNAAQCGTMQYGTMQHNAEQWRKDQESLPFLGVEAVEEIFLHTSFRPALKVNKFHLSLDVFDFFKC